MEEVSCPECGQPMEFDMLMTSRSENTDGENIYVCKKHPEPKYCILESSLEAKAGKDLQIIIPPEPPIE